MLIDPTIVLTGQQAANPFLRISRVEAITNGRVEGRQLGRCHVVVRRASPADVSTTSRRWRSRSCRCTPMRGFVPFSDRGRPGLPDFAGEISRLLAEGYNDLTSPERSRSDPAAASPRHLHRPRREHERRGRGDHATERSEPSTSRRCGPRSPTAPRATPPGQCPRTSRKRSAPSATTQTPPDRHPRLRRSSGSGAARRRIRLRTRVHRRNRRCEHPRRRRLPEVPHRPARRHDARVRPAPVRRHEQPTHRRTPATSPGRASEPTRSTTPRSGCSRTSKAQ